VPQAGPRVDHQAIEFLRSCGIAVAVCSQGHTHDSKGERHAGQRRHEPPSRHHRGHGLEQETHTLTWIGFLVRNLLPVTIGNLIGGVVLVGLVYWFVYLRPRGA